MSEDIRVSGVKQTTRKAADVEKAVTEEPKKLVPKPTYDGYYVSADTVDKDKKATDFQSLDSLSKEFLDKLQNLPPLTNKEEVAEINKRVEKVKTKLYKLLEVFPEDSKKQIKQPFDTLFNNVSKLGKKEAFKLLDTIEETISGKAKEGKPTGETIKLSFPTDTSVKFDEGIFKPQGGEVSEELKKEIEKVNLILQHVGKEKIKFLSEIKINKDSVTLPTEELKSISWGRFGKIGLYMASPNGKEKVLPKTEVKENADFPTRVLYITDTPFKYSVEYNKEKNVFVVSYGIEKVSPVGKFDTKTELVNGGKIFIPANEGVMIVRQLDPKEAIIIPPVSKK